MLESANDFSQGQVFKIWLHQDLHQCRNCALPLHICNGNFKMVCISSITGIGTYCKLPNQIFHCTRCITPIRVTSLRGPYLRHCVRATQHSFWKKCHSSSESLATRRKFDQPEFWTSNLPVQRQKRYCSTKTSVKKSTNFCSIKLNHRQQCKPFLRFDGLFFRWRGNKVQKGDTIN